MVRIIPVVVLLACVTALVACGGGSASKPTPVPTTQPTAVPTAAPTPDATATARRSGIPDVDAVIDAMLSGDDQQQRSLVAFQSMACTATAVGIGPFYCGEGEPDGTVSDVIPAVYCEGSFIRKDQFGFSDPTFSVYAIYDNGDSRHIILSRITAPQGRDLGLDLTLQRGRIVLMTFGCGDSPADMVRNAAPANFLLPPS